MIVIKSIDGALDLLNQKLVEVNQYFYPVFLNQHINGNPLFQLSDYFRVSLTKCKTKIRLITIKHNQETDLPDLMLICDSLLAQYLGNFDLEIHFNDTF